MVNSSKQLHIGFYVKAFPIPSQKFILIQIEQILKAGFKVTVIAENKSDHSIIKNENFKILELNNKTKTYSGRVSKFLKLFMTDTNFRSITRKAFGFKNRGFFKLWFVNEFLGLQSLQKIDLLHVMFTSYLSRVNYLQEIGLFNTSKILVSCRGYDVTADSSGNSESLDLSKKIVSKYLPVSSSLQKILEEKGIESSKISVVYSGIESKKIKYLEDFKFPSKGERLKILSIGRLTEKKGHDTTIELVAALNELGYDIELSIIGIGNELEHLKSLVNFLGISDKVNFLGQLTWEDSMEVLYSSHLFILLSKTAKSGDQEGIPNVLKEAMAAGIPCISTFHSGIPELLPLVKFGLLAKENDSKNSLNIVLNLLNKSPEELEIIRKENRMFIEEVFDSKVITEKLQSLYRKVIDEN